LDLPVLPALDETGKFLDIVPKFAGMFFKKANKAVIQDLQERGILYKEEQYTHSYPHCYRCETPLFYNAIPAWFVNVQKIKQQLIEQNEHIHWVPEHIKHGRFLKGLEGAPDWNISRNRYWASPLPIWKCKKCGTVEVIGSKAELKEKAVDPSLITENMDMHKHTVDPIQIRCGTCSEVISRIPEVIDCWVESASMPFAAQHYPFENQEWFEKNFPAQFVAEYVAQTRAWFYVMHVMSTILFGKPSFENVVMTGTIMATDGSKMSKSKKNYPDPWKLFEKYGVDSLRYYLMSTPVMNGVSVNFSEKEVDEIYKKLLVTLWNVHTFYMMFREKQNQNFQPTRQHVLDQWILSKAQLLVQTVTKNMDSYEVIQASRPLLEFVQELSTWYVRRIRDRVKGENEDDRQEALYTLEYVLRLFVKVAAPVVPFITEKIYQELRKEDEPISVHLCDWPTTDISLIQQEVLDAMQLIRENIEKALALRAEAGIKVRQPLPSVTLVGKELPQTYIDILKDELNVKEIHFGDAFTLDTNITEALRLEGLLRELVRQTNTLRKKAKLTIHDCIDLKIQTESEAVKKMLHTYEEEYKKSVLANSLSIVNDSQTNVVKLSEDDVVTLSF
ncbi:MAG TPA: class I tRNA ligase family protein, partial [Patescibacteria group bacterium]|nr:class I tRNA ligase family protein [Patescibacteria group bacterium]